MTEQLSSLPFKELPPLKQNELFHDLYNKLPSQGFDLTLMQADPDQAKELIGQIPQDMLRRDNSEFKEYLTAKVKDYLSYSQTTHSFQEEYLRIFSKVYNTGRSKVTMTQEQMILDAVMNNSQEKSGIYNKDQAQIIEKIAYQKELYYYMDANYQSNREPLIVFGSRPSGEIIEARNNMYRQTIELYLPILKSWRREYNEHYHADPFDF